MRVTTGYHRALLVGTRDGIRLIGGAAKIWNRCLAAGWIVPAVRAGPIFFYRYRDIAALAERLCRERPPRSMTVGEERRSSSYDLARIAAGGRRARARILCGHHSAISVAGSRYTCSIARGRSNNG